MENKKEMTAPNVSVGADTEQPIQKIAENSIYEYEENIKSFEEMQREMQLSLDPSYLKAVSMNELFDTQYQSKPPLIDGLLYPGTYIFAGSPKLGKSFLMAQLAYHVSTGCPMWQGVLIIFPIPKGRNISMLPIRRKGQHLSFGKILQEKISWILRREERQGNVSKGVSLLLHFPKVLFSIGQMMW